MLDTELAIRCGNEDSESFKTDIVIQQGEGLSANEITYTYQVLSTNKTTTSFITKMNTFA